MPVVFLRVFACVAFAFAVVAGAGWWVAQNTGHAVTLIAAGLLAFVLSTIPYGPVP